MILKAILTWVATLLERLGKKLTHLIKCGSLFSKEIHKVLFQY